MGAAAVDFEGFALEQRAGGPAQIFEGEHGMGTQDFAGGLKRVLHWTIGAGERDHETVDVFAGRFEDDFDLAGSHELFGQAFDEPVGKFGGTMANVAIGEFEEKCLCYRADVFAPVHEVRKLEEIFPAVAETFAIEGDG